MKTQRIILAGGTGFLGRILCRHFREHGCEVVVLTRTPGRAAESVRECFWDGRTAGAWGRELEGAAAVINLAGRSVDCRYNARNRRLLMDSRVDSTRVLGDAIARCAAPPAVWLNSSTATCYKHNFGPAWDEAGEVGSTPEAKDEFSVDIARAWEHAFNSASTPRTRKVALRTAMVFGQGANSVFPVLCRLAGFGLGGAMAGGRQYVSWIHETDFCRAVSTLIEHPEITGPVNVAAPNPVTNREMMAMVREVCGVPFGLPAAQWMLEAGAFLLRTETELIIKSRRVAPGKLIASGFQFRFPQLRDAMKELRNRPAG